MTRFFCRLLLLSLAILLPTTAYSETTTDVRFGVSYTLALGPETGAGANEAWSIYFTKQPSAPGIDRGVPMPNLLQYTINGRGDGGVTVYGLPVIAVRDGIYPADSEEGAEPGETSSQGSGLAGEIVAESVMLVVVGTAAIAGWHDFCNKNNLKHC